MQTEITWEAFGKDYAATASGVFLVTGKNSYTISGAQKKLERVLGNRRYVRFSDFTENPEISAISAGVKAFQASNCDIILAVGGGSAIDVAKAIYLFADYSEADHIPHLTGKQGLNPIKITERSLVAIPTTFGTGSESTHFAVVYIGDLKYSLAHPSGMPTAYVLDPALALSAPPLVRATTGTDALCQAIESYWAVSATSISRSFAANAIALLKDNLVSFVLNPTEIISRKMANAANLAGRAINLTKTTAPHALSYAITKAYGVPHGQAVALTLPAFFSINFERAEPGLLKTMTDLFEIIGVSTPSEAAQWFETLVANTGQLTKLREVTELSRPQAAALAKRVNIERLGNHPVPISFDDLVRVLLR